jgi:CheY-like chemotaxis protein
MFGTQHADGRGKQGDVLLIDDDEDAVRHARTAFDRATDASLRVTQSRESALAFLRGQGQYRDASLPDLVMLDLELEDQRGYEVLDTIRDHPELEPLPVLALTNSPEPGTVARSYEAKANACLQKPTGEEAFTDLLSVIDQFWLRQVALPSLSR